MKITLYDFLALSNERQFEIIFNQGIFIDTKIEVSSSYALYAIDRFFVEVEYDNIENRLINKRAFIQGELLDKYAN